MNEKMSKRRIQITDLQKQEIEEKQERRLLIRLHNYFTHLIKIGLLLVKPDRKSQENLSCKLPLIRHLQHLQDG